MECERSAEEGHILLRCVASPDWRLKGVDQGFWGFGVVKGCQVQGFTTQAF